LIFNPESNRVSALSMMNGDFEHEINTRTHICPLFSYQKKMLKFITIFFGFLLIKSDVNCLNIDVPSCSSLNVSSIEVITFDLFGALMLTEMSMERNIAALLPQLSSANVTKFTDLWLTAYVSYFGKSFDPSLTHSPFQWVINSSLVDILDKFQLSGVVPQNSTTFKALLGTWGNLQPKSGAAEVLAKLNRKYQLGLLSNGDEGTLRAALRVFPPSVNVSLIFSSDYPVNCFKTCSSMYAQALNFVGGDVSKLIHVAGSGYDAHGARQFGIFAGALDSSAEHTDPPPCFAFDDINRLPAFFHL